MDSAIFLKGEHLEIKGILLQIESFMDDGKIDYSLLIERLYRLNELWDAHEIREEKFFGEIKKEVGEFPAETMFLEDHKQLRGHWKVVQAFLKTGDEDKIKVALDTDGRMLIDKLRSHIKAEDEFFDSLTNRLMV
jgi:hypothetical protein